MNLPNKLTILRVIMIPFFVAVLLSDLPNAKWISLAIFCIASFTDFLDGYIARKNHLITNFGKFMDPLADKLLVCTAMICLVAQQRLNVIVVLIIIAREFIISGFRLVASDSGIVIAASYWGKFKTVSHMLMVILLLANFGEKARIAELVLIALATIFTVISLLDYVVKNKQVLTEGGM